MTGFMITHQEHQVPGITLTGVLDPHRKGRLTWELNRVSVPAGGNRAELGHLSYRCVPAGRGAEFADLMAQMEAPEETGPVFIPLVMLYAMAEETEGEPFTIENPVVGQCLVDHRLAVPMGMASYCRTQLLTDMLNETPFIGPPQVSQNIEQMLREFHGTAGLTLPAAPTTAISSEFVSDTKRQDMLDSEVQELRDAVAASDIVGIADAVCDIMYVVAGTGVTHGLPLAELLGEVHRSNMTKFGPNGEVTVDAEGKIVKGPWYEPPRLDMIIAAALSGEYPPHEDCNNYMSWDPQARAALADCTTLAGLDTAWATLEAEGEVDMRGGAEWRHAVAHLAWKLGARPS